jgi:hypothetical protein
MDELSEAFKRYVDSMDIKSKSLFSNASIASGVMRVLSDKYRDPSNGEYSGMEQNAAKSAYYVLDVVSHLDPKSLIDNALLHHAFARLLYIHVLYQWFSSLKIFEGGISADSIGMLALASFKKSVAKTILVALSSADFLRPSTVSMNKSSDVRIVASKVYSVLGNFPFMREPKNDVAMVLEQEAKTEALDFLQKHYNDIIAERKDKRGRTIYDRAFFNDPAQIEEVKKQDKLLVYMKIVNQILSMDLSDLLDINKYNFRESSLAPRTSTLRTMKFIHTRLTTVSTYSPSENDLKKFSTFIMQLIWAKIQYEWRMFTKDQDISESPMYVTLDRVDQGVGQSGEMFNFFFFQQMPPQDKYLNVEWTKTTAYVDRTDKAITIASTWKETHPPKAESAPQDLDLIGILNSMLSDWE